MKSTSSLVLAILASIAPSSSARSWANLVDPAIFLASAFDVGRLEKSLERDPFDFSDVHLTDAPTNMPSNGVEESVETPTLSPTTLLSESPTLAPTGRYDNIVGNGGCPVGKNLYEIRMTDSWGDGWDGTVMTIVGVPRNDSATSGQYSTSDGASIYSSVQVKEQQSSAKQVFQGRLYKGSESYQYACLQKNMCYTVDVGGGTWESEVKWEIRKVELGVERDERDDGMAVAKGLAPESCQFSIKNSYDELACPVNCGMEKTEAPSLGVSPSPSSGPTTSPTDEPSLLPQPTVSPTVLSTTPTQMPTLSPSIESDTGEGDDSTETDDTNSATKWEWKWNRNNDAIDESHAPSDSPSLSPSQYK